MRLRCAMRNATDHMQKLAAFRDDKGRFVAAVTPDMCGRWCLLLLKDVPRSEKITPSIEVRKESDVLGSDFYYPSRIWGASPIGRYWSVAYLPAGTHALAIDLPGADKKISQYGFSFCTIPQLMAASLIIAKHPWKFLRTFAGFGVGMGHRVRALLATLPTSTDGKRSYAIWQQYFDRWDEADRLALMASTNRSSWPSLSALIFAADDEKSPALEATLTSLVTQWVPVPYNVVIGNGNANEAAIDQALRKTPSDHVIVLQAGEILPPHASAVFAAEAARHDRPEFLYADEDTISPSGRRTDALFKPEASHTLMMSGTLSRGAWAIRKDVLESRAPNATGWAEALRLDAWLRLYEAGRTFQTKRIPFILTHRRTDTSAAPTSYLASIVKGHIDRARLPASVNNSSFPLQVGFRARSDGPKVSLIVPTMCRSPHVLKCLTAVLERTSYENFEMVIIITQSGDLDAAQLKILEPLRADPRTRLILLDRPSFNYSDTNNHAIEKTEGELVCLLNDDVEPINGDWLERMIGQLADPSVGAVGAKLCYSNQTLQHGGVIAGLGGVADHMNRFLPMADAGYASRAILNQELSAVTGACLLVRRSIFNEVGGLNESFPVAYNDIDLCLKIREAGYGIVFSAETQMFHYESLSFLQHYADDRACKYELEVTRMLDRWAQVCSADPFHNPNLSLTRGNEWSPAFPPRVEKPGRAVEGGNPPPL